MLRFLLALPVLATLAGPLLAQAEIEKRLVELEKRLARIEEQTRLAEREASEAERRAKDAAPYGLVAFLYGGFCALWAQNTRRNPWLWFFLGAIFSVFTVIGLLVKNSNDRQNTVRLPDSRPSSPEP